MRRGKQDKMTEEERKRIAGHRERLKKRFLTQDTDYMDDSRMLELLLTYAIPRIDVYPLATALLIKFGDLDNILSASVDELCTVKGIGPSSAILIKLLPTLNRKAILAKSKRKVYKKDDLIAQEMCRQFFGIREERLLMASFNNSMQLLSFDWVSKGRPAECIVDRRDMAKLLVRDNISVVALAHNHPNGNITPSAADIQTMIELRNFIESVEVKLMDMFIVHENRYFKMSDAAILSNAISDSLNDEYSYLYNTFDPETSSELANSVLSNNTDTEKEK